VTAARNTTTHKTKNSRNSKEIQSNITFPTTWLKEQINILKRKAIKINIIEMRIIRAIKIKLNKRSKTWMCTRIKSKIKIKKKRSKIRKMTMYN